jgi:uncharacterized protein YkwD
MRRDCRARPTRESGLLVALVLDELRPPARRPLGVPLPPLPAATSACARCAKRCCGRPAERASLAQWAADVGASERTMARLFREQLGTGYQQWRQQAVLAHALPLLARGVPVSQVAAATGYASESAFTAMFKAAMGQPPSQFQAAPPLRLNPTLAGVATAHAADMARYSYFSHTGRDGSNVDGRATRAGYPWRAIGENIAAGQMTADTVVQGWINSPGHCANIMSPAFSEMGAAFVVNNQSSQGIYWAQVFGATP